MARSIVVVEYQPSWVQDFRDAESQLLTALGECVVTIDHIGSTSVPGLAAKPIIDILVEVESLAVLDARTEHLSALGYIPRGENGISGRRYFCKGSDQRTHHLHMFQSGSTQLACHRAFRHYLNAHPAKVSEYAELKRRAAIACRHNSEIYMSLKADFMTKTLALALEWHAGEGANKSRACSACV